MSRWRIEISQNGWEYTGYVIITAHKVEMTGDDTIIADGVKITFDECIRPPRLLSQED